MANNSSNFPSMNNDGRLCHVVAGPNGAGLELTPDVWERLAADRRQALEDDLAWIHP